MDPRKGPSGSTALSADGALPADGRPLYRFRKYPGAKELATAVAAARTKAREAGQQPAHEPTEALQPDGEVVPLADLLAHADGAGDDDAVVPVDAAPDKVKKPGAFSAAVKAGAAARVDASGIVQMGPLATAAGQIWVLLEPLGDLALGTTMEVRMDDVVVRGATAILTRDGKIGRAALVLETDAPGVIEARRKELKAALLPPVPAAGAGSAAVPVTAKPLEDMRTLAVDYDSHGERHKDWREVCHEAKAETYDDDPVEGPVTAVYLAKMMYRKGGDPIRWLSEWSRDHNIGKSDRVYHELLVLATAFSLAGSYDQLNIGACRSVEKMARRIQAICDAYSSPGQPPNWKMAKHLDGEGGTEVVAPALRSFGVRRARDDYEVSNVRVRGLFSTAPGDGEGEGGAGAPAASGAGDKAVKGAGRGRGAARKDE